MEMGPDDSPDGSYGGDFGGDFGGGVSTAGQGHPGNRGRGRGRGRGGPAMGYSQGYNADPYGEFGAPTNTVDPGLAQAMADSYASLQDAFGNNAPGVGYGRGISSGSKGMPQHQRDMGWAAGQTLTDQYGNPTTLDNLSFARDDLLDDSNYKAWAQQNPGKVRSMPGMMGGFLNSMGLHDLSGAMTPQENAFADSRWGGSIGDPGQAQTQNYGAGGRSLHEKVMQMAQEMMREKNHKSALAAEGGNHYDGRFERRSAPAFSESGGDY